MAMGKRHEYKLGLEWTGNKGEGTKTYRSYSRDYSISADGKPIILGSSDPAFRGDAGRFNPEDFLVAGLSACHMLSYLHLCAVNGIVVMDYKDAATGWMEERPDGSGAFTEVVLHPEVTIAAGGDAAKAESLHEKAHELCFIANSVNFGVRTSAKILEREV
jgi:organic hydroperoxide reductase OsmC/OhrA